MPTLDWKVTTLALALFGAVSFVVCVVYGLVVPSTWHPTQLLVNALPGFTWLTPASFVLGLIESAIYGAYAGLVFTPIYNFLARRAAGASGAVR
jgi:hypothetical protein